MRLGHVLDQWRARTFVPEGSRALAVAGATTADGDASSDVVVLVTDRELVTFPPSRPWGSRGTGRAPCVAGAVRIPFAHVFRASAQAYVIELTHVDWVGQDFSTSVYDLRSAPASERAEFLVRFADAAQSWVGLGNERHLPLEASGHWWSGLNEAPTTVDLVAWRTVLEIRIFDTFLRERMPWEECAGYAVDEDDVVRIHTRGGRTIEFAPESVDAWCDLLMQRRVRRDVPRRLAAG